MFVRVHVLCQTTAYRVLAIEQATCGGLENIGWSRLRG
jgi:hypothetical protein